MSPEAIIAICSVVLTSILIPIMQRIVRKIKKKQQQKLDKEAAREARELARERQQEEHDRILAAIPAQLEDLRQDNLSIKREIQLLKEQQIDDKEEMIQYQIQNLKYMINDAFFGYSNIHEIPYETLIVAADGCDIYTGQGYNHEIGARCELIYAEISRRQQIRGEGQHHE